jgi:hypothetical protein
VVLDRDELRGRTSHALVLPVYTCVRLLPVRDIWPAVAGRLALLAVVLAAAAIVLR